MQTNSQIEIPPFALKLRSEFPGGASFGTGFIVDYRERSWLFTCWHNIGPVRPGATLDLSGELTATHISFVASGTRLALEDRRIVGASIDGEPVDVAAIELSPHEKPPPPWFEGRREMTLEGFDFPSDFRVGGKDGGEMIIVPITRHYLWQGFPGADPSAPPVAFRAVDFPGSVSRHPWMLRYAPGGLPGTSGCPVQQLEGDRAHIAGIHVHHYASKDESLFRFEGKSSIDGRPIVAQASFEWGAAVPVELMYRAIDLATNEGVSVIALKKEDITP